MVSDTPPAHHPGDFVPGAMMTVNAVMIDSREPEWVKSLKFGDVPTAVTLLEVGDVWLTTADNLLIIERKAPQDLLASIADNRLFTQAAGMVKVSPWSYVVVTGQITPNRHNGVTIDNTSHNWNYNSIQGALLTVQELGVKVLFLTSESDFANCLTRLAGRNRLPLPVLPARSSTHLGNDVQILSSLPGIGLERALEVSRHFPSTAWALSYLTNPKWEGANAVKVTGIGERIKAGIRNALGLAENEYLSVDSI